MLAFLPALQTPRRRRRCSSAPSSRTLESHPEPHQPPILKRPGGSVTQKHVTLAATAPRPPSATSSSGPTSRKHQGRAREFHEFDELGHLKEEWFRAVYSAWNRSRARRSPARSIAGTNPPFPRSGHRRDGGRVGDRLLRPLGGRRVRRHPPRRAARFAASSAPSTPRRTWSATVEVPGPRCRCRGWTSAWHREQEEPAPLPPLPHLHPRNSIERQRLHRRRLPRRPRQRCPPRDAGGAPATASGAAPCRHRRRVRRRATVLLGQRRHRPLARGRPRARRPAPRRANSAAIGVDPSRGGNNATVVYPLWELPDGRPFLGKPVRATRARSCRTAAPSRQIVLETIISALAAAPSEQLREWDTEIRIDSIGIGSVGRGRAQGASPPAGYKALNGKHKSWMRPRGAAFHAIQIANARAEYYWRLREALDPQAQINLCLPAGCEPAPGTPGHPLGEHRPQGIHDRGEGRRSGSGSTGARTTPTRRVTPSRRRSRSTSPSPEPLSASKPRGTLGTCSGRRGRGCRRAGIR